MNKPFDPAAIAAEIQRASIAPDAKRPLFREIPNTAPFPLDALGAARDVVEAIISRTQSPPAMCAQAVLAAITLAVQAHRDVALPGGGRKPLTGLFATVAESGERKSSVDRLALAPVHSAETRWLREREALLRDYHNDHDAWKAARESAKKAHKDNRAGIRNALSAIGAEPRPPHSAMLLIDDFSPESLVLHLRDARPWAGVFTAEGGVLIGGHAFSPEKAMQTGAVLNTLWDGSPIRRTRVLTGTAHLPGRRCMTTVLDVEPATEPDVPNVLTPALMTLAPDAHAMRVKFYNAVERDLAPGGEFHAIKAFGAKLAEHAGRLAAVLAAYAAPDALHVHAEHMACGIALAQYYGGEMLRLAGGASVPPDLRLAARLLAWRQDRPDPRCHLAMIYQRGLNAIRDASVARRIVGILEEHGWVRRLAPGTEIEGKQRKDAWELVP